MVPERGCKAVVKRQHSARLAAFRPDELELAAYARERLGNRQRLPVEVYI